MEKRAETLLYQAAIACMPGYYSCGSVVFERCSVRPSDCDVNHLACLWVNVAAVDSHLELSLNGEALDKRTHLNGY